jgi:hypothetical protein
VRFRVRRRLEKEKGGERKIGKDSLRIYADRRSEAYRFWGGETKFWVE